METTLTIRIIDPEVKQKLQFRAASHDKSIEAEAREILASAVNVPEKMAPPKTREEMRERLDRVRGIWKERAGGRSTDEIMLELRGDD